MDMRTGIEMGVADCPTNHFVDLDFQMLLKLSSTKKEMQHYHIVSDSLTGFTIKHTLEIMWPFAISYSRFCNEAAIFTFEKS